MKKIVSGVIAFALIVTVFAGCSRSRSGSTTTGDRKIKVGLSMSERDQWLSNLEAAAKAKADALGVELSVQDANRDIAAQLSHVQAAANQGFDVMIVGLVNTSNAQEIINAAGDMAIVFVNRRPDDSVLVANKVVYAGSTESDAGKIQGDFLSGLFKAEGKTSINCVMFQGSLGAQHATERTAAAKKAFQDNGITVTYVFDDTADWDRSKAMEKFIQFAGMGVSYDVVVANNDEMSLGVVEAIKTMGQKVTIPIVGIDATANAIEAVENGDFACTVFQNAVGQGETSVEVAYKIATGQGAEKLNLIPFELVTKENIERYKGANKG
jgi:ABC-type sugar transport system substrate-binding protein